MKIAPTGDYVLDEVHKAPKLDKCDYAFEWVPYTDKNWHGFKTYTGQPSKSAPNLKIGGFDISSLDLDLLSEMDTIL